MWVLFDGGFVSIVQKRESEHLCVRARQRGDLAKFCRYGGAGNRKISETPEADYRFRVILSKGIVTAALRKIVSNLDYDNFKSRVAETDRPRAHLYGDVWATLEQLQPPR